MMLAAAAPAAAAETPRLPDKAAPCVVCHGRDGVGVEPEIPKLAGQNFHYLFNRMVAFRDAAAERLRLAEPRDGPAGVPLAGHPPRRQHRSSAVLDRTVAILDDGQLRTIAGYYASIVCGGPGVSAAAAPTEIQQCGQCHGARGIAEAPGIPNLAGQKPAHLARELRLLRATDPAHRLGPQDTARASGLMSPPAMQLDDARVDLIATWYAAQPCR